MVDDPQIRQIKACYRSIEAEAPALVTGFYGHLFRLDPSLRRLCNGGEQEQRWLLATLDELLAALDHWPLAARYARFLGRGLGRRGVTPQHYSAIGAALLAALRDCLGPRLSSEAQDAWAHGYARIAHVMREVAPSPEPATKDRASGPGTECGDG